VRWFYWREDVFFFLRASKTIFACLLRMMSIAPMTSDQETMSSASTYTTQSERSLSSFVNASPNPSHRTGFEFRYSFGGPSFPTCFRRTKGGGLNETER